MSWLTFLGWLLVITPFATVGGFLFGWTLGGLGRDGDADCGLFTDEGQEPPK